MICPVATARGRSAELDAIRAESAESWEHIDRLLGAMGHFVREGDASGDLPQGVLDLMPANVFNRLNLPCAFGGHAATGTARRRALLFEAVGRICPALPMALPGPGLAMPPILALGTPEQKTRAFALFTESDVPRFGAFAITEPQGGSDAVAMRTTAIADGDSYVLNGEKCFITNGARADLVVVFATIAPHRGRFGVRAFLIERGTPGFRVDRREDMLGLRASQLATLSFTDCRVPASAMLGHTGRRGPLIDAFTGAQSAWDYMRPALASGINGACFGILEHADGLIDGDRGALDSVGAVRARASIAAYRARVVGARLVALAAADRFDAGQPSSIDASLAKAHSAALAMEIAEGLASLFPAHACARGEPIEKFYRDAKAFDILEGTGDMQRLMISRAFQPTLH